MPATGGRRGRRDNGLSASQYDAVGDVDPRVGEHLLDVLAGDGIAAYLQPSTDQHPITRTTSLPARPTDRLYVDSDHVDAARDYVRQVTAAGATAEDPEPDIPDPDLAVDVDVDDEPDVDTAWAEIIAGYHLTAIKPRDEIINDGIINDGITLDEPRLLPRIDPDADPEYRAESRPWRRVDPADASLLDALDTFGATLPEDDDEGYTPPPAPPLPRISAAAALGVAAIVFGLLLFVWPDLLPMAHNAVLVLAFGMIVAGFGTLIWRLRPDDDEDDDFDDGARI